MPEETSKGLKPRFAEWLGFNTFSEPALEYLLTCCQEWVNAMRENKEPRWLSIIGSSGTGKTHCAVRMWNWAYKRFDWSRSSFQPRSIYWPDFVQRLRAGERFDMRTDMKSWPVLFLDDIGAERDPSGFASEELNTLLGCRMGRWTIITSNKDFEALSAVDGRISSRLIRGDNICVGVKTKDYAER